MHNVAKRTLNIRGGLLPFLAKEMILVQLVH